MDGTYYVSVSIRLRGRGVSECGDMSKVVKRGFASDDPKEFGEEAVKVLHKAAADLQYLLNQGYHIKSASTFVGNHYLLSERQRLALARGVSSTDSIRRRKEKQVLEIPKGSTVHIDGFNTVITLEVALSESLLLKCMDGTVRDLAALRGTYRLIDKTETAIDLIGRALTEAQIGKAVFYLDAPVSNSGRLKQKIVEQLQECPFEVQAEVISNVDSVLERLDQVITGDAIILDKCDSWINLNARIIDGMIGEYPYVDFS